MVVVADGKLAFSRDRIVSATQASKNFGECRKRAKGEPLFVTDRNARVDTVIVDYDEFESMALELERLRLEGFYAAAAERLSKFDNGELGEAIPLSDVLDAKEYREFLSVDADETEGQG